MPPLPPDPPPPPPAQAAHAEADRVVHATRLWLEQAVIGLGLCPFAGVPHAAGRVRYRVSAATDTDALLDDLLTELRLLADTPAERVETTLLIHPSVLADFEAYNDFLGLADLALVELRLDGVLQVASFHPDYRFAGTDADDITNATNRAPWPILHLLREASVARAVEAVGDTDAIVARNLQTMQALGADGWAALRSRWTGAQPVGTSDDAPGMPGRGAPSDRP